MDSSRKKGNMGPQIESWGFELITEIVLLPSESKRLIGKAVARLRRQFVEPRKKGFSSSVGEALVRLSHKNSRIPRSMKEVTQQAALVARVYLLTQRFLQK